MYNFREKDKKEQGGRRKQERFCWLSPGTPGTMAQRPRCATEHQRGEG
jgi:hypothetical protein